MKKVSKSASRKPIPGYLECVFEFDANWDHQRNGLFRLPGTDRLFLANSTHGGDVIRGPMGMPTPTIEANPENFEEVTLKKAIEWLVYCDPWASSSTGSLIPLLQMAAKQIPATKAEKRGRK